ncbi:MAG: universal stress protein, partial [Bacteroidales bacterium]|nr:universal stress protein [Bacteroidales bacterium]
YENFSQSVLQEVEHMAQNNMFKFIDDLKNELVTQGLGDVKYHYNLSKGKPEYQIVKLSERYKPYLIILGTKGVGHMPNDIIGSVTLKVIENTKVPVLAIPEKWKFKGFDLLNILYATDFHDSDFTAFNKLLEILKPFKTKFDCIHIEIDESNPWKEMQMFKLESFLGQNYSEHDIKCHIIKHPNLIEGIQEFIDLKGIDIISFTSPKRNILQKLIIPNNLKKMVFQSTIPILIFHSEIK